jgi:6-phosphogluconate dehydrogenase
MHIGLVGLGKMGANMRTRIRAAGIEVTGYDRNPDVTDVPSLDALVAALPEGERIIWVMVPSGEITNAVITALSVQMSAGDIVIDGGNSYYQDDKMHAEILAEKGVDFLDAGV